MSDKKIPRHVAIIMDGNGRWAKQKNLPRIAGHKVGVDSVRAVVRICGELGVEVLTLFAFSTENWSRPKNEVDFLMDLLVTALTHEIKKLHSANVVVKFIGDRLCLNGDMQEVIKDAEELTCNNKGLKLVIATNYSGRWDIVEAAKKIAAQVESGKLTANAVTLEILEANIATANLPDPDLLIRTSGEQRISNFMLWQLAYTELYFTNVLWPDFREDELKKAFDVYSQRDRRFGALH